MKGEVIVWWSSARSVLSSLLPPFRARNDEHLILRQSFHLGQTRIASGPPSTTQNLPSQTMASSPKQITTSCPFPFNSPSSLLRLLHLPELLIQLNPLVTSFQLVSPASPASSSCSNYSITDRVPLLFGYLSTSTTYTARFTPTPDGQIVNIKAGLGISTRSVWKVEELEGESGGSLVTETSEVSVAGGWLWSWLLKGFVEGQIKESHGVLMRRLKEKVEEIKKEE